MMADAIRAAAARKQTTQLTATTTAATEAPKTVQEEKPVVDQQ